MSLYWDELKMAVEMPQIDNHIYVLEEATTAKMVLFLDEVQYVDSSDVPFGEYYKRWNGYGAYEP